MYTFTPRSLAFLRPFSSMKEVAKTSLGYACCDFIQLAYFRQFKHASAGGASLRL